MAEATPKALLDMAIERSPGGRNDAGFWLAQQLHANGYTQQDAEAVMRQYAASVTAAGNGSYTDKEALSTLQCEYRRAAKDPWTGSGGGYSVSNDWRADKARKAFPTAPPKQREADADSVERFQQARGGATELDGTPAADYLESRGIPADLAKAARCAYAAKWGRIGKSVVFPIRDEAGKVIAANGRAVTPDKNSRTYGPKSMGAFYTPGALDSDPVAITEAPIDALTLALAGLPALALAGCSGIPSWLIKRLGLPAENTPAGHSRTVYLAFDNDPAGETAAAQIGAAMPLVKTIRLRPNRKDWNEDLTTGGLDSLRDWLKAAGTVKEPEYPPVELKAVESSPVTTNRHSGRQAEQTPEAPPLVDLQELEQLAEAAGFPAVSLRSGETLRAGPEAWASFLARGSEDRKQTALEWLKNQA